MSKRPDQVRLDFVAPLHEARVAGALLCAVGLAAAVTLGLAFRRELAERSRLDAAIAAIPKPQRAAVVGDPLKSAAEAVAVERELAIPWMRLLAELEAASQDTAGSVSLLHVQPDPARHVVRITAEVRALPDAIAYLRRLQKSPVLRYPMLESHERRKDDPEHPLRIKLSAEWRT